MSSKLDLGKRLLLAIIILWNYCEAENVRQFYPQGRIVGGTAAREGQFPYQVSLRWGGAHVCGGSIVSASYIVTAAHCLTLGTAEQKYVDNSLHES